MPFPDSVKIVCFASIFVFPEIGPVELKDIFRIAKRQGKIVCADMTKRKKDETIKDMADAFSYIDYLFPNDEEEVRVIEIDKTRSENVRRWWPFFRDRRIDAFGGLTERFLV